MTTSTEIIQIQAAEFNNILISLNSISYLFNSDIRKRLNFKLITHRTLKIHVVHD
jgi:hypothetical protein